MSPNEGICLPTPISPVCYRAFLPWKNRAFPPQAYFLKFSSQATLRSPGTCVYEPCRLMSGLPFAPLYRQKRAAFFSWHGQACNVVPLFSLLVFCRRASVPSPVFLTLYRVVLARRPIREHAFGRLFTGPRLFSLLVLVVTPSYKLELPLTYLVSCLPMLGLRCRFLPADHFLLSPSNLLLH